MCSLYKCVSCEHFRWHAIGTVSCAPSKLEGLCKMYMFLLNFIIHNLNTMKIDKIDFLIVDKRYMNRDSDLISDDHT
jgi:hypothetical protein